MRHEKWPRSDERSIEPYRSLDKCVAENAHFDETYRALEWLLARNPNKGP